WVFGRGSGAGSRRPIRGVGDVLRALGCVGWAGLPLLRYLRWTVGDALRCHGLVQDRPLCGLLSMLLEDTVHAGLEDAPLINGALGVTIRGAGLTRAQGGMFGFWRRFVAHYRQLGGVLRVGCPVRRVERLADGTYRVHLRRGEVSARQVVSAVPIALTSRLAPPEVARWLAPHFRHNSTALGGAVVVFLGVPEAEVAGQTFTHHQLLQEYGRPLGNGNNMVTLLQF